MCVYRIYDHLLPTHVALVRFVAKQTGALALPLFVEGRCSTLRPLKVGIGTLWLLMHRQGLTLRYQWLYSDGGQVWSPFVKLILPRFTNFGELEPWIKRRSWLEYGKPSAIRRSCSSHTSSASIRSYTLFFYRGLVKGKCNDVLVETLGFDDIQLTHLFRRTFGSGPLDNFQKFLARQCYQGALLVHNKLTRHDASCLPTCKSCEKNPESVLHAIVQCPRLCSARDYRKCGLTSNRCYLVYDRLRRPSFFESIIKDVPPTPLNPEGKIRFFLCGCYSERSGLEDVNGSNKYHHRSRSSEFFSFFITRPVSHVMYMEKYVRI